MSPQEQTALNRYYRGRIAQVLGVPSREHRRWSSSTVRERACILHLSSINTDYSRKGWNDLTAKQQRSINMSFNRISQLANYKRVN